MDDRWRDTYDAWKTRAPDLDIEVCEACGANLHRDWHADGWYCPDCADREAELEAFADDERGPDAAETEQEATADLMQQLEAEGVTKMAEERKHTPGPWRKIACPEDWSIDTPFDDYSWFTIGSAARATDSDAPVAFVSFSEADARLVAAAPDLLEALQNTFALLRAFTTEEDAVAKAAWEQARAAIKRATEG